MSAGGVRQAFDSAAAGFVALVTQIPADAWERPGLGVWDVRALVGHTSRALSTIETYLGAASDLPPVESPADYFLKVLAGDQDAAIAERGRAAGEALGPDPAATITTRATHIRRLVTHTPDNASVASPAGPMTLADYLPTRTFELTVHTLDLARALNIPPPPELTPAITASLQLAATIAAHRPQAPDLLLQLTGRDNLPPNLTIL